MGIENALGHAAGLKHGEYEQHGKAEPPGDKANKASSSLLFFAYFYAYLLLSEEISVQEYCSNKNKRNLYACLY